MSRIWPTGSKSLGKRWWSLTMWQPGDSRYLEFQCLMLFQKNNVSLLDKRSSKCPPFFFCLDKRGNVTVEASACKILETRTQFKALINQIASVVQTNVAIIWHHSLADVKCLFQTATSLICFALRTFVSLEPALIHPNSSCYGVKLKDCIG